MAESINPTTALHQAPLESVLDSILTDITNVRTGVNAAISDLGLHKSVIDVLASKLNADGGVSDTNYAGTTALNASSVTALSTTT